MKRNRTFIIIIPVVFILFSLGIWAYAGFMNGGINVFKSGDTVSEIKTLKNGKKVVYVDGKPFQTYGVQVRADTWRRYAGVSNEEMSKIGLVRWARELNANCVQIPIAWREIEVEKDKFHWTNLDWAIEECKKYGLRLEILWFGSDVCGSGWSELLPDYIINDSGRYQRIVRADGSVLGEGYKSGEGDKIALCREDTDLIEAEQHAVEKMMEHLEAYDDAHTVIGIQVENEPTIVQHGHPVMNQTDRCYCAACNELFSGGGYKSGLAFSRERLAVYLNNIAGAVKSSGRKIYTRVNFITAFDVIDESIELTRKIGKNIDFISFDNYGKSQYHNYNILSKYFTAEGNIPHVAEQEGASPQCREKIIDALAANGYGSEVYRLAEAVPGTDNFLLDHNGKDAREHTPEVRNTFGMLNKVMYPMALKKNGNEDEIQFFNCMGYTEEQYGSTKILAGIKLMYKTRDSGIGIAFREGRALTVLSARPGEFTVHSSSPGKCEIGRYDTEGRWITEGIKEYHDNGNGTYTVVLKGYEVVRLADG